MKRYFIHNPLFRIVAPAVYGVLIYLLLLLVNNNVVQVNELFNSQELYVCIVLTYISFESNRLVILAVQKYFHIEQKYLIPLQLGQTTIVSVLIVLTLLSLYFKYFIGFKISGTQQLIFGVIFGVTALLYNLLFYSNYFLQKENTLKLNAEKQQRDVLEMEMMEFKNDINPDLLYESLENLIALMYRDVEKAEDYIDSLASAYRYVLTNRHHELVSVATEINAAKNLIGLLNERYFGQLKFESAFEPDELQAMLIPGSLPIIIENLIRNTIVSRFEPFVIRCYLEDDYITIQSRLNDKLILHETSDLAMSRLQKSYSLYSDLPLIRVKAYQENYVKLPVITLAKEIGIES